ncbi:DMT family transporter [Testudinibacter aquarius]|uniref:DMT family transporter n=1 Tax=Testudinibacter aquarius TaxID=1524974 RepID=A0A4R3YBB1_9PAST|nr:DMT family transporter [Testudinibacter aquarius]KAE9528957.1 RhaT protein [Testudinibacter aquarius]TCV89230.1 drug/metabolite transporter (DMT)-like permease [Testudinibacter aquarius]TNG93295.1 DMT family transporter [Testudinibacter aquarius]
MQKYRGELILLVVSILAASGWLFSKYSLMALPPAGFISVRFLAAALLFLPFAYPQLRRLSNAQLKSAVTVGAAFSLNLFLWVQGMSYTENMGEGAFIVSLSMLLAPLVSWLVFKHRPQRMFWFCLPLAAAGLFLLASGSGLHLSLGNLLFLCSSLAAATSFVLNNQFSKSIPALPLTTIQLSMVGLSCGLFSLAFETWPDSVSLTTWNWVAASVLIATGFRFLLQAIGQKHSQITNAAIIMILEPVWTLLLSVSLLGEIITWQKGLGCMLILTALFAYRLQPQLRYRLLLWRKKQWRKQKWRKQKQHKVRLR